MLVYILYSQKSKFNKVSNFFFFQKFNFDVSQNIEILSQNYQRNSPKNNSEIYVLDANTL